MVTEYLEFHLLTSTTKTKVYSVNSKLHGDRLGIIKWYGPWRQYTFWPQSSTIWNRLCLNDVMEFLQMLMAERKEEQQ